MKPFKEIREILVSNQGSLAIISFPSLISALDISNSFFKKSDQIDLVGILVQENHYTVFLAGEVGYLNHAMNTIIKEFGGNSDQIPHTVIVRPHELLIDWLEQTL